MRIVLVSMVLSAALLLSCFTTYVKASQDIPVLNTSIVNFEANSLTKSDSSYWVWGNNYSVPTQIHGISDVKASFGYQLVVKNDGTLWRWDKSPLSSEINVIQINEINDPIASTYQYPLILDESGNVYELPSDLTTTTAILIQGIDNVADITYYYNTRLNREQWLFLKKDGTVWTSIDDYQTFESIPDLDNVTDIEENHMLKGDGTVWTLPNLEREHTDRVKLEAWKAIQIESLEQIRSIVNNYKSNVAIDDQSRLWFWGSTITGVSDGTTFHEQPAPILLTDIEDVKVAYFIERSIIVHTNNGKVYEASYDGIKMPADLKFNLIKSNVEQVRRGDRHIIMRLKDGTLWGWGVNKNAQLGRGDYEFMYETAVPIQKPISILLNDKSIQLTNGVIVRGGQAFIPIRSIFEQLGANVAWDNTNKIATISQTQEGKPQVIIEINYKTGEQTLNNSVVLLENKPFTSAGNSYLPLRFISEELGAKVDWFQHDQKIVINS